MFTHRSTSKASDGSHSNAVATLVSEPRITSSLSPLKRWTMSRRTSTACPSACGPVSGRPMSPKPSSPLQSCAVSNGRHRSSESGVHGDASLAPLDRVEGALHPAFKWDVPGNDGDRLDVDVRVLERYDHRNGVVRGGVSVDKKAAQGAPPSWIRALAVVAPEDALVRRRMPSAGARSAGAPSRAGSREADRRCEPGKPAGRSLMARMGYRVPLCQMPTIASSTISSGPSSVPKPAPR